MSELRDKIYQQFHGFAPIERNAVKKGESAFYYIDPRYEDDDKRSQIDVYDKNTPNPMLKEILTDELKNNPEDYYIWRTEGDDKVRDSHAERDGKIFNWYVPTEGGHPGEDHNCRCWAEPFEFKEDSQEPFVIDLSGLENLVFDGQNTDETLPFIIEDYAHRKYVFENPKEEKLLTRIGKQIIARESFIYYAYLDSSGYITTGCGALVDDFNSFQKVHWIYKGRPATKEEISAEFERMQKLQQSIQKGAEEYAKEHTPFNPFQKITADKYEECHVLEITKDEAYYLMYQHLHHDYINLKRYLPKFDSAPEAAQDVAFDIQYNPGITPTTWTYLKKYFNEKNVEKLAQEVYRKGVSENRNNEMREKILSIKKW